ncbi:AAA family ATPase [Poseidonibacter lekithochrous]|uniref:McrB family protein n=1 Tax=Poseidonibacter TaxID=2321187 RepID=UPI001C0819D1|nr:MULTISPECIES: AAA family ATPase [Poseidonibacter]MBU3013824.1 AAA family ATPase [Poseidonibacter lekithochrous]MDO6827120.1 AAA family ATPase [Poseidonibacter sp. 1_MG-2023]
MPENNIITEEQVIDMYQKLINYSNKQLTIFEEQTQSQIVENIKNKILNENSFEWNETSLLDYLNALIYMIKGQQFARTINSFSKRYLLKEINKDFGEEIYNNAKKSLELHEEYYRNITNRRRLKKAIKNFKDKWDDTDGLWRNEYFEGIRTFKNLKINVSYGYGNRIALPKTPYMNFLKEGFLTNNGAYPFITYIYEKNEFEIGISLSRENRPNLNENIVNEIQLYKSTFISTNDLNAVVNQLDICIKDFFKILNSNHPSLEITKQVLEHIIENYTFEKEVNHYFKIDNKDKLYPRRFIVNEAAKYQNLNKEYNTNEAKQILENIFGNRIEFITKPNQGNSMQIKNIILYGAPGVGKTHNYKKLISLIEKGNLKEKDIFKEIETSNEKYELENFNDDLDSRIEFITFHQSFGYEDFIEGFRPNEEGNIKLENGILKKICKNLSLSLNIFESRVSFFKTECLDYSIDVNEMINELNSKLIINSPVQNLLIEKEYIALILRNKIRIEISNGDLENWLHEIVHNELFEDEILFDFYKKSRYIDIIGSHMLNRIKVNKVYDELIKSYKKVYKPNDNKYLVIDEINRGNISKIFGELITLIEESKRDNYEVTLPYSKEKFSVPSNLFIIGTMNTTDKSIALIDVALRRRFTFIKMQPNSNLVIKSFKETFEKLNEQIKTDLGEEYQIGHSYFMNIEESDLDFVKEYKIKPLLEEYYYGENNKLQETLKIIGLEKSSFL